MHDDAAVELEQAIADAATWLVRVDKYRRGREADVARIRKAVADLGARARRSHRAGPPGESMAGLRDEARAFVVALEAIVAEVLAGGPYRDAVAAYDRGDDVRLHPLLLQIFADLADGPTDGDLFVAVDWSGRRGPRPAEEVAAAIDALRADGIPAVGDLLAPGTDPELPAVTLSTTWPDGAPVALACRAQDLDVPSLVGPAGEVLVHRPRLRVAFAVVLQTDREAVDDWVEDLAGYRRTLAALLERRGHVTREASTPAAP
jgi:hypothetical protein